MIGLAIIPTVYESPYFDDLCVRLWEDGVKVIAVCNRAFDGPRRADGLYATHLQRPSWGIYKTWNFGMRVGALFNVPTLILNDDIILPPSSARDVCLELLTSDYAIIGFNYDARKFPPPEIVAVRGTYRHGGIGGFAFGVNPRRCARVDQRFMWWGGDDDLMFATEALGGKIGIGPWSKVEHPRPSLTANAHPELLPEGWAANDHALLVEKWSAGW